MNKLHYRMVVTIFSLLFLYSDTMASPSLETPNQPLSASFTGNNLNLSLQDAVYYSLQGNNDIQIASYGPQIAEERLGKTKSVYDPVFLLSGGTNRLDRPIQSQLDTGVSEDDSLIEDRWSTKAELKKHISTGGSLSLYQEIGDLDSSSTFVIPNPQNTSRLTGQVIQPLLRDIGDKENKSLIQIAQTNIDLSKEEFQQKVMDVMLEVISSYWQVHFYKESFLLNTESLNMAEEIYRKEKVRFEQGLSKQLDVDRSKAAIETRTNALYRTQIGVDNSMNRLKYLINSPDVSIDDPDVGLTPTERPVVDLHETNTDEALAVALKNRPEIIIEEQKLKMAQLKMNLADHKKLPRLDAKLDYVLSSLDTNAGDAIKEVYNANNAGWSARVEFQMPLGNNEAISEYQISQFEYKRVQGNIKKVREQIITEVYSTKKELGNAAKQIQTAENAFKAREKVLISEEALYQLAKKTNEDLLKSQEFVNVSKQEYLRAIVNYNKILAKFSRVKGALLEEYNVNVQY